MPNIQCKNHHHNHNHLHIWHHIQFLFKSNIKKRIENLYLSVGRFTIENHNNNSHEEYNFQTEIEQQQQQQKNEILYTEIESI